MNQKDFAKKLCEQIKNKRTQSVVLESARELYKESDGNYAIINEIVGYMADDLQDVYVVSEQFDNQNQLSAMAYLRSIIDKAQADNKSGNSTVKRQG